MKKYSALILAAIAFAANAGQISERQAAEIARKYMPETPARKMARAKIADGSNEDTAPYYVFNFGGNGGFVVISGDDSLTELIGYSNEGTFSTENMPQNLSSYFATYAEYVEKVQNGEAEPIKRTSETGTPVVSPFVTTKWNQDIPFNNLCPEYATGYNCPTGCVATAIAQVMKYYEYPAQGKGSNSYYDYLRGETVSTDFSQSTYDWDNMLDEYSRYYNTQGVIVNEYTDVQANAVARLMKDCGAAVQMRYSQSASGAVDYDIPYGVANYFGYNSSLHIRSTMTDTQFLDMIKDEIDNRRPVVYCGTGSAGGHCFVADGYDSNDMVHINWGWGGLSDGYYDINVMAPPALGIGGGGGGFVYGQSITTMQPSSDGNGVWGNSPLTFTYDNSYREYVRADREQLNKGDRLTIEVSGIANMSAYDYSGHVAVAIFNTNGNRVAEPSNPIAANFGPMEGYFAIKFTLQSELQNLSDGEYMIYPVSKETRQGSTFDWMRVAEAERIYITVSGNQITVGEPVRGISMLSVSGTKEVAPGGTVTANMVISNNSGETAEGTFNLMIKDTATGAPKMRKSVSFTAYSGTDTEISTEFTVGSIFENGVSYTATIEDVEFSGSIPFEMQLPEPPSFTFTINENAGISGIDANNGIRLYPNPVADILKIDSPETVTSIQVYGSDGRLAKSAMATGEIDLSDCPSGYYIVVVTTENATVRQSVIKR